MAVKGFKEVVGGIYIPDLTKIKDELAKRANELEYYYNNVKGVEGFLRSITEA